MKEKTNNNIEDVVVLEDVEKKFADIAKKLNTYIQGNGSSKKLKKKSAEYLQKMMEAKKA